MEQEVIAMLGECIALANRLADQLEQDSAAIGNCISGAILKEYRKGNEKALELARSLSRQCVLLQEEQALALLQS